MFDKDFFEENNDETRQDIQLGANTEREAALPGTDAQAAAQEGMKQRKAAVQEITNDAAPGSDADWEDFHTERMSDTVSVEDITIPEYSADSLHLAEEHAATLHSENAAEEQSRGTEESSEQDRPFGAGNSHRPKRRRKGPLKRAFALVASAAVFGLIAGGTMVGVQKYARVSGFLPKSTTTILGRTVESTSSNETTVSNLVSTPKNTGALDVSAIAQSAMPSVVAIYGKAELTYQSWFGRQQTYTTPTSGSGIIIGENDEELLIVTNNHVVDQASDLSVVFIDDSKIKAEVKGGDSNSDLAVIAVKLTDLPEETRNSISIASIGNSDNVKVGEGVVAIGNALGYGQSVTQGIVSAKNREIETQNGKTTGLIQTDAAINPGNSGGALLNLNGEVIGINSIKYTSTEVEGMGYAIPITTAEEIIKDLSSRTLVDESKQGTLGIQGQDIDQTMSETYDIPQGVYVYRILENGAAVTSELQEKDIIIKLNSYSIKSMEELKKRLSYFSAGDKVTLTIQRLDGSEYVEKSVEITLGKKSDLNP